MPNNDSAGARILAAHARHYASVTAEREAARAAGAPEDEIALLDARVRAAHRMYQQIAADMPAKRAHAWWRF